MTVPANEEKGGLMFTGERFIPGMEGQIAMEHIHRYLFAAAMCAGKRVLDAACGEGYGSAILAGHGASVVGVDISEAAVDHAGKTYGSHNLEFIHADVVKLPFARHEFDIIVSFETIEHHDRHEEMMAELKRVMKPGGILVISSPDRLNYSIIPQYSNPFHVKELLVEEFLELVCRYFDVTRLYGQRVVHGSLLVSSQSTGLPFGSYRQLEGKDLENHAGLNAPLYDILVASDQAFDPPTNSFYEQSIHGMPAAEFYSQHVMEKLGAVEHKLTSREERDAAIASRIVLGVQDPLAAKLEAIDKSVSEFQASLARLSESVSERESRQNDANAEIASLLRMLEAKDEQLRASEHAIEISRDESAAQQAQVHALNNSVTELEKELERIREESAHTNRRFAESEENLRDTLGRESVAQAQVLELRQSVEELEIKLEGVRTEKAQESRHFAEAEENLRRALDSAEQERARLVTKGAESSRALAELAESMQSLEARFGEKVAELDKAAAVIKTHEDRVQILRESLWWRIGRFERLFQA